MHEWSRLTRRHSPRILVPCGQSFTAGPKAEGGRWFESIFLHRRVCKPSVPREIRVTPENSGGGRPSLLREAEIVPPAMIVAASSASVAVTPAASCAATPPQAVARG